MSVVDFAQVRATRAEQLRQMEKFAGAEAQRLVTEALDAADRAFRWSGPIGRADEEVARAINRVILRKTRSSVRRRFRDFPDQDSVRRTIETVTQIYTGRLLFLIDERDAKTGGAA